MPRNKKLNKPKQPGTTSEFLQRLATQPTHRNGLKKRLGFANHRI